jgi:hypothetical protein
MEAAINTLEKHRSSSSVTVSVRASSELVWFVTSIKDAMRIRIDASMPWLGIRQLLLDLALALRIVRS